MTPGSKKRRADDDLVKIGAPRTRKEFREEIPFGEHPYNSGSQVQAASVSVPRINSPTECREEVVATDVAAPASITNVARKKSSSHSTKRYDHLWNDMFNRLKDYKDKNGNCLVPQNYHKDTKLGRWVHYQRVEFWLFQQQGHGKITQARIDKLKTIGFEWYPQRSQWDSMLQRLADYKSHHGNCMIPKGYKGDPELANWVRNQRLEYSNLMRHKKSRMTDERKERLEELGFRWSTSQS